MDELKIRRIDDRLDVEVKHGLIKTKDKLRSLIRNKNEYLVRDRIKIQPKLKNTSDNELMRGNITITLSYPNGQQMNYQFNHSNIKPHEEVYCENEKGGNYFVAEALSEGYCLIKVSKISEAPVIDIDPYTGVGDYYVSDLKTFYAGWALGISMVVLVATIIKYTVELLHYVLN